MYVKVFLILSVLFFIADAELARRFVASDGSYLRGTELNLLKRENALKERALEAAQLISEVNARSNEIAQKHAELRKEYDKAAKRRLNRGAAALAQQNSRMEDIRGLLALESEAFKKALARLGEFHYGQVPKKPRRVLENLPLMSDKERGASSEEHLKKGIVYFQSEDLKGAIRMWEAALELDPGNKTAADYKKRAEMVLQRLNEIRAKDSEATSSSPTPPPF